MTDLSTTYMGLNLINPIIAGSSALSNSVAGVKKLEEGGAGAVVLKSIFEEEIIHEMDDLMKGVPETSRYMERFDYHDLVIRRDQLKNYTTLIREAKENVSIPIIASINCAFSYEWTDYAKRLETAGADAIELNMFFLPTEQNRSADEIEQTYFKIIESVLDSVSIPVSLKISHYFTHLGSMIHNLSNTGISGLVLFNRFYSPDFDIEKLKVVQTNVLSSPAELSTSLRWIAMMSQKISCELVASTGVHDGAAVIKQLLAGAQAVQVVSALYQHSPEHIHTMVDDLESWMCRHNYKRLENFRGKMSQDKGTDPATYERVQFMKYFTGQNEIT